MAKASWRALSLAEAAAIVALASALSFRFVEQPFRVEPAAPAVFRGAAWARSPAPSFDDGHLTAYGSGVAVDRYFPFVD